MSRHTKQDSPELDSCAGCRYFHEQTATQDEMRWGECHRYPPAMLLSVQEDGSTVAEPVVGSVCLPYGCGEFKPRLAS